MVGLLLAVALFAVAIVVGKGRRRQLRDAWKAAADQLGCRYDAPKEKWYASAFPRLEAAIGGAQVVAYTSSDSVFLAADARPQHQLWTHVVATAEGVPANLQLRARRRSLLSVVEPWADVVEATTGHEAFDAAFVVESNAPDLARRVLNPQLVDQLLALKKMDLVFQDGEARVSCLGSLTEASTIRTTMGAAAALALSASEVVSSWRALADAVGGVIADAPGGAARAELAPITVERGGMIFRVEPADDRGVEIAGLRDGEPLHVRLDPALFADAGLRPCATLADGSGGAARFRLPAAAAPDIEGALDLLVSASAEEAPYR